MRRLILPIALSAPLLFACHPEDGGEDILDGDSESESGDMDTGTGDEPGPEVCDPPSPYMGGWDIGCCQDETIPSPWQTGLIAQGTVIPDWTVTDQFGEQVRLYDFCHEAIYLEYGAGW